MTHDNALVTPLYHCTIPPAPFLARRVLMMLEGHLIAKDTDKVDADKAEGQVISIHVHNHSTTPFLAPQWAWIDREWEAFFFL